MKSVVTALFMVLAFKASAQEGRAFDIIVVAGQSNAEGAGLGVTSDDLRKDAQIFQLGRIGADNWTVIRAQDPLQNWHYPYNEVGFAMSFAREYVKTMAPHRELLLLPAASGGSSISMWSKSLNLYADMQTRINEVIKAHPRSRIVAFLWHQGETDVELIYEKRYNMPTQEVYNKKLTAFVNNIRADFPSSPLFPIVMGEPVINWKKYDLERCQVSNQIKLVAKTMPMIFFAGSKGLTSNFADGWTTNVEEAVHFSAKSQTTYGKRYFQVYRQRGSAHSELVRCGS